MLKIHLHAKSTISSCVEVNHNTDLDMLAIIGDIESVYDGKNGTDDPVDGDKIYEHIAQYNIMCPVHMIQLPGGPDINYDERIHRLLTDDKYHKHYVTSDILLNTDEPDEIILFVDIEQVGIAKTISLLSAILIGNN